MNEFNAGVARQIGYAKLEDILLTMRQILSSTDLGLDIDKIFTFMLKHGLIFSITHLLSKLKDDIWKGLLVSST